MGGGSSVHFDCVGVFDCGASHQSCGQGLNISVSYLFGNEFIMSLRPNKYFYKKIEMLDHDSKSTLWLSVCVCVFWNTALASPKYEGLW